MFLLTKICWQIACFFGYEKYSEITVSQFKCSLNCQNIFCSWNEQGFFLPEKDIKIIHNKGKGFVIIQLPSYWMKRMQRVLNSAKC